jgi:phasin family protein
MRFAAVKSMGEAFELQSRYAQESMETLVTEVRKAQDLSATVAKDAVAPLAERFKATVNTFAAAGFPLGTPASNKKAA